MSELHYQTCHLCESMCGITVEHRSIVAAAVDQLSGICEGCLSQRQNLSCRCSPSQLDREKFLNDRLADFAGRIAATHVLGAYLTIGNNFHDGGLNIFRRVFLANVVQQHPC